MQNFFFCAVELVWEHLLLMHCNNKHKLKFLKENVTKIIIKKKKQIFSTYNTVTVNISKLF